MASAHAFLLALTIVLGTAAVTTVLFQWLRQPVVLGYILAGVLVGPHVPVPIVADPAIVQTLSELGVILLMFSIGLEFNLGKLVEVGPTAGVTAIIQCSIMTWLGFVVGRAFGWTWLESLFCGACLAISSTTIIVKAFDEAGIGGRQRQLVLGILIVEDLIAILLMASLTALASGSGLSASDLAVVLGRLAAFLAGLVVVGLLVVPRTVRAILRLGRAETVVIFAISLSFGVALLAQAFGYSVALGAFIAGSLVAESGHGAEIEHRIEPVRDLFAAIFFVSVGMMLEPGLIVTHGGAIALLSVVVIFGQMASVTLGAFLVGNGTRGSIQAGMSMAQIGEFAFIIAGLGVSLGATRDFLYPVAVTVSAITTLTTPWLIRASGPVASLVDRKLPRRLQTFATLYGSWIERLGRRRPDGTSRSKIRSLARRTVVDAAIVAAIVIGAAVERQRFVDWLGLDERLAKAILVAVAAAVASPFVLGLVRLSRRLGTALAQAALPAGEDGKVDLSAAPRRALVLTLQLEIMLLAGLPLVALTQPFLPSVPLAVILLVGVIILGMAFWRSAAGLQGHVRAGAEVLVESLRSHARGPAPEAASAPADPPDPLQALFPGLGAPVPVHLDDESAAVGRTLAEIDLRGLTGATVLAIIRGDEGVTVPTARERLRAGDVLALAGSDEAVAAARTLLAAAKPA